MEQQIQTILNRFKHMTYEDLVTIYETSREGFDYIYNLAVEEKE